MWETVFKAINGLIALAFIPYLFDVYRRTKRNFYLFWEIGFSLLGLRLILRIILQSYPFDAFLPSSALLSIIYMFALVFIIAGLGKLVSELIPTPIIVGALPLAVVFLYILLGLEEVWSITNMALYSFICVIIPYINRKYHLSLNHLMLGLAAIFVANLADQFQLLNTIYSEVINISGRLLLFMGLLQPRFKFLAYDISGFMSAESLATVNNGRRNYALVLLESAPESKRAEIKLFTDKLKKNLSRGIRTVLIALYDLITFEELAEFEVARDDLHLVRMHSRNQAAESEPVFQENESVIRDKLEDLDIVLSEIIEEADEEGVTCEIFLYNLSVLINMHGVRRIYSFLTSKLPKFKSKGVPLYAYLHPKTHEHKSEIAIFESLADNIQKIV